MQTWKTKVLGVVEETSDTKTFFLDRELAPAYRAGQFLTLAPHQFSPLEEEIAFLEESKGHGEPPRAYSLSSCPAEESLSLTIKEEHYQPGSSRYPPLLSPFLVRGLKKGDSLECRGFAGNYVLPEETEGPVVHICAGSGIVPNFSILKQALLEGRKNPHFLIYSNRTWGGIIFRRQLEELEQKYSRILTVRHTITRQTGVESLGDRVHAGRVSLAKLQGWLPDLSRAWFFVCGPGASPHEKNPPPQFMESILNILAEMDIPSSRIRHEAFG